MGRNNVKNTQPFTDDSQDFGDTLAYIFFGCRLDSVK